MRAHEAARISSVRDHGFTRSGWCVGRRLAVTAGRQSRRESGVGGGRPRRQTAVRDPPRPDRRGGGAGRAAGLGCVRRGDRLSRPSAGLGLGEVTARSGERPVRLAVRGAGGEVRGVAQVLVREAALGRESSTCRTDRIGMMPRMPAIFDALVDGIQAIGRRERGIVAKMDPRADGRNIDAVRAALLARGARTAPADLQARLPGSSTSGRGRRRSLRRSIRIPGASCGAPPGRA